MTTNTEIRYTMILDVPARLVPTVFEVLKDEGIVIKAEPFEPEPQLRPIKAKAKTGRHYVNGVRNKGISGEALVIQCLEMHGRMSKKEMAQCFAEKGFAAGSADSTISRLMRKRMVETAGDGFYTLAQSH